MQPRRGLLALALISTLLPAAAAEPKLNTLTPEEVSQGWILLFDGESTFGWEPRSGTKWIVEEGALCYQPGSGAAADQLAGRYLNYREFRRRRFLRLQERPRVSFRVGMRNAQRRRSHFFCAEQVDEHRNVLIPMQPKNESLGAKLDQRCRHLAD